MDHQKIIARLRANLDAFMWLFHDVSVEQARWKPDKNRWSLLEVINHLHDEEREDFRQRLQLTLDNPDTEWPPIDPEGWVLERGYNGRDLTESLQNYDRERKQSLQWLDSLERIDWMASHFHPPVGHMSAEQILANWLAHDLFHIRQVTDLYFAWLTESVSPVTLDYSGWE